MSAAWSFDLKDEMVSLKQGDHLCLLYDRNPAEQMPALIPFIHDALSHDEQFIYIADDQTVDELAGRLEESGVNVGQETDRGALKLWTRREWRQPGELDSDQKSAQVRHFLEGATRAGFKGSRFAVEMTWTLGPEISAPQLEHWEATLNTIFVPGCSGRIICQYNRSRLAPEVMMAALHTHPLAIISDEVFPNLFYQAPLILNGQHHGNDNGNGHAHSNGNGHVSPSEQVEWMISQLKRARSAEKDRAELIAKRAALAQAELAKKELEETVTERTASLREAIRELEAFSYSISHDLRAPLRSMQGFSQMLLDSYATALDEQGRNYLQRISNASKRLDVLIQEVLNYTRVGRIPVPLRRVDVAKLMGELIDLYPTWQPPAARIEIEGTLPPVSAHEGFLTQCLSNLIGNAIKFVAPGVLPVVRLRAEAVNGRVRISVRDNGVGIAPENHARIFHMFERVYSQKEYEGTGIGLTIVRKAVERMGGEMGFASALGRGSEFWIDLKPAEAGPIGGA